MSHPLALSAGVRKGIVGFVLAVALGGYWAERAHAQGVPGIGPTAPPSLGPTFAPHLGPTAPPILGPSVPWIGPTVPSLPRPIYSPPPRFSSPSIPPQVRWHEQRAAAERDMRSSQMAVQSHNQAHAWRQKQAASSLGRAVHPAYTSPQPGRRPFWRLRRLFGGW